MHFSNKLGPVVLVDHGRLESLLVICSRSSYQRHPLLIELYLLVVHDSVNVRDDSLIGGGLDGANELFFRSPVGSLGSFLVKLSQVPDVVTAISACPDGPMGLSWKRRRTYRSRFRRCRQFS